MTDPNKLTLDEILKEFGRRQNPILCSPNYDKNVREEAKSAIIELVKETVPKGFKEHWLIQQTLKNLEEVNPNTEEKNNGNC